MVLVREMEMAARDLYQKKSIRGFLHLFVGQVHMSQPPIEHNLSTKDMIG
jgi:TPP-dependent pyruvate/acetoin dehydrogenase alpha subunit